MQRTAPIWVQSLNNRSVKTLICAGLAIGFLKVAPVMERMVQKSGPPLLKVPSPKPDKAALHSPR